MVQTIEELASECDGYLYRDKERDVVLPAADAPQWFTDLCLDAHGDFMPDDWKYEFIQDALRHIADGQTDELPDLDAIYPYTADRLRWIGSNLNRPSYCDEAMEECGKPADTLTLIAWGMQKELEEVHSRVLEFLNGIWEDQDEEDENAA